MGSPPSGVGVALVGDGRQLGAAAGAADGRRGGARSAWSCAGSAPWTVAARGRRRGRLAVAARRRRRSLARARPRWLADELIGRWLFYVAVVPLQHAGRVLAGRGREPPMTRRSRARPRAPAPSGLLGRSTTAATATATSTDPAGAGQRQPGRRHAGCARRAATARSAAGCCIGVRDGQAVAVQGDPDHPVNRGPAVPEGPVRAPHDPRRRPAAPRRCVDGRPATWDAALDRIVGGFRELLDAHGPESVAVLSTGQLVTEEFYALGKLVRLGMGLRHYDGNTTLCMASAVAGYKLQLRHRRPARLLRGLRARRRRRAVGRQRRRQPPAARAPAARARPAARSSSSTRGSRRRRWSPTSTCRCGPAATSPCSTAILRRAARRGPRRRRRGCAPHVDGLDELLAHLRRLDGRAGRRGVRHRRRRRSATLARTIGRAERCVLAWTMGVNHSVQGTETVTLLNTLALLTGNIGRPGRGAVLDHRPVQRHGHPRGRASPPRCPATAHYDDPAARAELAALLGHRRDRACPPSAAGPTPTSSTPSCPAASRASGSSAPTRSCRTRTGRRSSSRSASLDLLVVQDGFETPTTALADVVLPAAIWGEKDGTFTNSERRVSRVRAAVDAARRGPHRLRHLPRVAERWGCADELFAGWNGAARTPSRSGARVSAGRPCDYSGIT